MTKGLKVLSLFCGIGTGLQALKNLGIEVETYDAFEIDPYAIKVAQKNHPEIKHHGSVVGADFTKFQGYDLILAGSPCQGFSFCGKQLAFEDPRSKLFFEFVRALNEVKPKYFLLENVKMKKEYSDKIDELVGVKHIIIDSAKVSGQTRKRLYWTNIPNVTQPEDLGILLRDIIHENNESPVKITDRNIRHFKTLEQKSLTCTATMHKGAGNNGCTLIKEKLKSYIVPFDETFHFLEKEAQSGKMGYFRKDSQANRVYYINNKAVTLCGASGGGAAKMGQYFIGNISFDASDDRKIFTLTKDGDDGVLIEGYIRKLTVQECEILQTLPDSYTKCEGVSDSQRYKMLGNGFTCKVIEHILSFMK
jgi:DNA (cytosine-5)-methyltransferase 3A